MNDHTEEVGSIQELLDFCKENVKVTTKNNDMINKQIADKKIGVDVKLNILSLALCDTNNGLATTMVRLADLYRLCAMQQQVLDTMNSDGKEVESNES